VRRASPHRTLSIAAATSAASADATSCALGHRTHVLVDAQGHIVDAHGWVRQDSTLPRSHARARRQGRGNERKTQDSRPPHRPGQHRSNVAGAPKPRPLLAKVTWERRGCTRDSAYRLWRASVAATRARGSCGRGAAVMSTAG
jgi:hypothetical protein